MGIVINRTILPLLDYLNLMVKALHSNFLDAHPEYRGSERWPQPLTLTAPPPPSPTPTPPTKPQETSTPSAHDAAPTPALTRRLRANIPPQRPRDFVEQQQLKRSREEEESPLRQAPPPVELPITAPNYFL